MIVVVKIGSSSLTDVNGVIDESRIAKLCDEVAEVRHGGHGVIVVTSGAISAGLPELGFLGARPKDTLTLQAAAAVGQSRLLRAYDAALASNGLVGGQILLSPSNFFDRRQYLYARETILRLLKLGVVPVVNENDAVADDEIRFGDNDRIAALVAHSVKAELLLLLSDIDGLYTADPRTDEDASLVEEVLETDREIEGAAGGAGSDHGTGGMASKLAAARMAAWSGVRTVIASAERPNVVVDALVCKPGVGTLIHAHDRRLGARKLWIAFAMPAHGTLVVDDGARAALLEHGRSLLAAGITRIDGIFEAEQGVDIAGLDGQVFAKGVSRCRSTDVGASKREVVHRDDLVLLR